MIFNTESVMKPELRACRARTSNAIEAHFRTGYRFLCKNEQPAPMLTALPVLLRIADGDVNDLRSFYKRGKLPTYDRKEQEPKPKRMKKSYYELSNSRAPDNNEAVFGDTDDRKEKVNRKKDEKKQLPVEPPEHIEAKLCMHENDITTREIECAPLPSADPKVQNVIKELEDPIEEIPKDIAFLVGLSLQGM